MEPILIRTVVCSTKGCSRGWWSYSADAPDVCPICERPTTPREEVLAVPLMDGTLPS